MFMERLEARQRACRWTSSSDIYVLESDAGLADGRRHFPKHFAALIAPFAAHWTLVRDTFWAWS